MVYKSVLYQAIWEPMALHLLFYTLIQCSSYPNIREVQAAVMGSMNIICYYDTYQYRNLASSWCQQVSMKECDNIVETNQVTRNSYKHRATISQNVALHGFVNVTMINLQLWDTGLYKWRVWTGQDYEVLQNVLLQVVYGLPSKLHVIKYKVHDTVELPCEYNQNQTWSKTWVKQMDHDTFEWVAHSDGNSNVDYKSKVLVFNNKQKRVLIMRLTQLELWDSGIYQCRESGGQNILNEVLLLVTLDNEMLPDTLVPTTPSILENTRPSAHLPPVNTADRKYINLIGGITHLRDLENISATVNPKSGPGHNRAWEILRWIFFLCMVLCVFLFTYYKRLSAGICLTCNRSLRPQRHDI
ncbi:polymeric immunoglobulin receptor-like isoform X3 [Mixophyes fleayi]|uniref:polymeric immunoglobulin receptor-like isoform X3 n=1 Tax=Mixophyes fleayi TaxID=3061075 RepID=UPI003F4E38AB